MQGVAALGQGQPLQADVAQAGQVMGARAAEMVVRLLADEMVKPELLLPASAVNRARLQEKSERPPAT